MKHYGCLSELPFAKANSKNTNDSMSMEIIFTGKKEYFIDHITLPVMKLVKMPTAKATTKPNGAICV